MKKKRKYKIGFQVVVQVDDYNVDLQQTDYYPEDGIIIEGDNEREVEEIGQQMWDVSTKVVDGEYKIMGTTEKELLKMFGGETGEDGEPITFIDECEMNHIFVDEL